MKDKMRMVKLSDIIVTERYRIDMGDIEELKQSIQDKGILQPITLSADLQLLAGGRRYTASKALGLTEIPALLRHIEGEIDAREIELIENIHRKEFTWQERAKLTARIHAMYKEKDIDWSGAKTAKLLDQSPMGVSRALNLAANLEMFPELSTCKTADEAQKLVKKAEEHIIVSELMKRQKEPATKHMSSKEQAVKASVAKADKDYIISDVFEGMKKLGHKKFPLIECDPPFAVPMVTSEKNVPRDAFSKQQSDEFFDIDPKEYPAFLTKLAEATYSAAANDCWMVFWFAMDWYTEVQTTLEKAGWKVDPAPGIWVKSKIPSNAYPHNFAKGYHSFFLCKKGSPIMMQERRNNVFIVNNEAESIHPNQRPVALMKMLISALIAPAQHILIPFLGSGATLRAAYDCGNFGIGFDSNSQYKDKFLFNITKDAEKLLSGG